MLESREQDMDLINGVVRVKFFTHIMNPSHTEIFCNKCHVAINKEAGRWY